MFTPAVRLPSLMPGVTSAWAVAENSACVDETGATDGGGGCCWCRLFWRLWWNILNTSGCRVEVLVRLVNADGKTELRRLSTNVFTIDNSNCTSNDEVALSAADNGTFSVDDAAVRVCSPVDVLIGKWSLESLVLKSTENCA